MAALTANYDAEEKPGEIVAYNVLAATTIYKNALVMCVDASGYVKPAADSASHTFVGVAMEGADNSAGASGASGSRGMGPPARRPPGFGGTPGSRSGSSFQSVTDILWRRRLS